MPAGNAVCDCDLPNSCVCKVDITSNIKKAPTYTYNQKVLYPIFLVMTFMVMVPTFKLMLLVRVVLASIVIAPKGLFMIKLGEFTKRS